MVGKDVEVADSSYRARIKFIENIEFVDKQGEQRTAQRVILEKLDDGKQINVSTDLVEVAA